MGGEVQNRCRHTADIDNVASGGPQALNQRLLELWTGITAVAADNGFYLGASVGQSDIKIDQNLEDIDFSGGATSYKEFGGFRFLTFLGVFGIHRFYMGKIVTGLIYLLTGGLFLVGIVYDYWTLNEQISELNRAASG